MNATDSINFGQYLTEKREERGLSLRKMAQELGVSATYLSGVEKSKYAPLIAERLENASAILELTSSEKDEMYDLASQQRDTIAPDLIEYIKNHAYISFAIRTSRETVAGEDEWLEFIEKLKHRKRA